ncbi:UNVERIFIED_CONTAM: hypothetical protein K2H54_044927 [Gekko kuhli]
MKGRLEIMMGSFFSIEPKFLLTMRAVGELSKFQPPISRDLRTSMVAWALGLVLSGSPAGHEDAGDQGLWQEGEKGLHRMLLAFLREDPLAGNFFTLLDVNARERHRRWPLVTWEAGSQWEPNGEKVSPQEGQQK